VDFGFLVDEGREWDRRHTFVWREHFYSAHTRGGTSFLSAATHRWGRSSFFADISRERVDFWFWVDDEEERVR
jgi:hypothetical protein